MSKLNKLEKELNNCLIHLLQDYKQRDHKHKKELSFSDFCQYIIVGSKCGAVVGATIAGVGAAIGTPVGAVAGVVYGAGEATSIYRHNKKLNNAEKVEDFLGSDAEQILKIISIEVINQRREIIINLEDKTDTHSLAEYLAVNIMKAIKLDVDNRSYGLNEKINVVLHGLHNPRSAKKSSQTYKNIDGSHTTSKAIAEYGIFGQSSVPAPSERKAEVVSEAQP